MFTSRSGLVFFTLFLSCSAFTGVIPFFKDQVRKFNHFLNENPISRTISDLIGDGIAIVTRPLTDIAIDISRVVVPEIKKLLDFKITKDFLEDFLQHFHNGEHNEDAYLNITELVPKYGYVIERHEVETNDGYILTMHRIPQAQRSQSTPTVFLMHGLLGSSDDWVVTGPDHGLAYVLAKNGYDVWMGNARGNIHSKRHISLSPTESPFWDFSWNEIGRFDLPAMIDYALTTTGRSNLKYVGFSQGTTSFFVMCSEMPEYNKKIEIMTALSPVAWMTNVVSPLARLLAPSANIIHSLLANIGVNEFLPNNMLMKTMGQLLCGETAITQILCSNALFLISGFSLEQLNATTLPIILGHTPAGASVKQLVHYGQGVISKDFRKLNRGEMENFKCYKSITPPSYNVQQITAPVALFYAEKDWLANPKDVDELRRRLPNVVEFYKIPRVQFNHLDYIWGVDAKELVFAKLLQIMEKF